MPGTILITKCCAAKVLDLGVCPDCLEPCEVEEVCADCGGSGVITSDEFDDDGHIQSGVRETKCRCQY